MMRAMRASLAVWCVAAACAALALSGSAAGDEALPDATFLFPRPTQRFPTRSLDHLEPVLDYAVLHADNLHLHSAETRHPNSNHPLKVGNAANSIGAHSLRMRYRHGHKQPFPDSITVKFRAFDRLWEFHNLQLETTTWEPHTFATVVEADGTKRKVQHSLNTYKTMFTATHEGEEETGWAIITLAEDGLMTAVIHTDKASYQINPLFVHDHEIEVEEHATLLRKHAVHGMVMFKHTDAKHLGINPLTNKPYITCGSLRRPDNATAVEELGPEDALEDDTHAAKLEQGSDVHAQRVATARRLLAYPPGYGVTRWTSCYTGDQSSHKVSVGVASDTGYGKIYGTSGNVLNSIASVYASINAVYMAQFNVYLSIGDTSIHMAADSTSWNLTPDASTGRCATAIDTLLNAFTTWRGAQQSRKQSIWHQLTNCYPPPGTVGLAYIGELCSSYGTGVSSWTSTFWLVVAHETGHNFGAQHTFQDGQGSTGGIMDYGDGQYPVGSGIYQFHPVNQPQICSEIASIQSITGYTPFCFASYAPECGNGVVESGEACDDTSSCCVNCQLVGKCTPGSASAPNPCCSSSCQWMATSTSCNNGMGFCANGVCKDAVCGSAGLPYCGLEPSGCLQICGGGNSGWVCQSDWQRPDTSIPDGTVCNLSPYSTCSAGECTPSTPTVTYSWVQGTKSACSCSGTYTQTVTCKGSDGSTASDSKCTTTKPATSGSCTPPSSCYSWVTTAWTTCSNDCGAGTQTRSVTCTSTTTGAQVSLSQCTTTQPASQQSCNLGACPTAWVIGDWGSCTVSCGSGVQGRSVQCMQTQNGAQSNVASQYCPQPAPDTSRPCNTEACTQPGQYLYSAWTACSVSCGGGIQTRTQICTNPTTHVAYPDATNCAGQTTQPTQQPCNTPVCPHYEWHAFDWGTCSTTCGGGTQTRVANCYDDATDPTWTAPVNINYCTFARPATVQTCNVGACPIPPNYVWLASSWGTCSASCDGGVNSRTVTCVDAAHGNTPQPDSSCSGAGTKPATTQSCNVQGCPVYTWTVSGWSACTVSCGGGTQSQSVTCRDQTSGTAVSAAKCMDSAPPTERACNTAECPPPPPAIPPHTWSQDDPSPCSKSCNGGTQTYTLRCYRTDRSPPEIVDADICDDLPKPPAVAACNTQSCPTYWYSTPWSACSANCGPSGTKTRQVKCIYSIADPSSTSSLGDVACTSSKPATVSTCNSNPCATWEPSSEWGPCSTMCGSGVQTRNLTCRNYDGTPTVWSACEAAPAPDTTRVCEVIPCPHWHRNTWGDCSKLCADAAGPGVQNRTVTCRFPHDDPAYFGIEAPEVLCLLAGYADGGGAPGLANAKPETTQVCATDACPPHFWQYLNPSECSQPCGGGTRTATVVCVNAVTGETGTASQCLDAPPPATYPCNTFQCPEYEWFAREWEPCPSFCGAATQTREVQCRNTRPNPSMHSYGFVDVDLSFCANSGPKPATSRPCAQAADLCWGTEVATGGKKNGRCNEAGDACICRQGFSGANCTIPQQIRNVQTNVAQFASAGIPWGEPLLLTWESDPVDVPRVSIILQKDTWVAGQYLAYGVQNLNTFSWSVGDVLQDGLDAGAGYTLLVFASKAAHAVSEPFTIADPCAYKSCGLHGTCSSGLCTCSGGYSGPTCGMGPCEAAQCDPTHSSCNNVAVVSNLQYLSDNVCALNASTTICLGGYTGAQCKTPPACAHIPCLNGGDLENVVQAGSNCTGKCACRGNWFGDDCGSCSVTCLHGGELDSDCTQCSNCHPSYFGHTCECKFFTVGLRLNTDVTAWFDPNNPHSVAQDRWTKTLEIDIVGALQQLISTQPAARVQSIHPRTDGATPQVDVTIQLSLRCASTSSMMSTAGAGSAWSFADTMPIQGPSNAQMPLIPRPRVSRMLAAGVGARRHLLDDHGGHDDPLINVAQLLDTLDTLLPLLSDMNSAVWQGQITGTMDPNFTPTVSDPSGEQKLQSPEAPRDCFDTDCNSSPSPPGGGGGDDSSDSSVWGKVKGSAGGIVVFVVVLLAIVGVVAGAAFWAFRRYQRKSKLAVLSRMHTTGMESEMTQNPALHQINTTGRWNQL